VAKKIKRVFQCQNCGYKNSTWLGKCPQCQEWNTFVEQQAQPEKKALGTARSSIKLSEVTTHQEIRYPLEWKELNHLLGGGLVKGSLLLLGGGPGVGKSTMMLQAAVQLPKMLYVSAEESASQVRMRAERLQLPLEKLSILCETELESILQTIEAEKPQFVVLDSIQAVRAAAVDSLPGSIAQVKLAANQFMEVARKYGITFIIIGHITKDGMIAGPKVLEHLVDTVLYFENNAHQECRIVRSVKNRFGAAHEIAIFEMSETGLREAESPSTFFLEAADAAASGSAVTCFVEGSRPFFVELQALVTPCHYGIPQRVANGYDTKRLALLLAVLDKFASFQSGAFDVFINVTGGIRLTDPAADLAIISALFSGLKNRPLPQNSVFLGEVGLRGEIRRPFQWEMRVKEIGKMQYEQIFAPIHSSKEISSTKLNTYKKIETLLGDLF